MRTFSIRTFLVFFTWSGRHLNLPATVGHQHRVGRGFIDGALQLGGIDMNHLGMAGGRACSRDTGGEQSHKDADRSHVYIPSRFTQRRTPTTRLQLRVRAGASGVQRFVSDARSDGITCESGLVKLPRCGSKRDVSDDQTIIPLLAIRIF